MAPQRQHCSASGSLTSSGSATSPRAASHALQSSGKYNWRRTGGRRFRAHTRTLLRALLRSRSVSLTWPKSSTSSRTRFATARECGGGIEYNVAAHLLRRGFRHEGLAIVSAIPSANDGLSKSVPRKSSGRPLLARAASWSVTECWRSLAFEYEDAAGAARVAPNSPRGFRSFFSCSDCWHVRAAAFGRQQQHSIACAPVGSASCRCTWKCRRQARDRCGWCFTTRASRAATGAVRPGRRVGSSCSDARAVLVPGTQGYCATDVTLLFAD